MFIIVKELGEPSMKKIFFTVFLLALSCRAYSKDMFLKAGGGFSLPANASGIYSNGLNSYIAGGLDISKDFAGILSGELNQFPVVYANPNAGYVGQVWSIMASIQFQLLKSNFFRPYLFTGIGLDFYGYQNNGSLGIPSSSYKDYFGFQFGLGTDLELNKNTYLFIDLKVHFEYVPPILWSFYPILAGLKFDL